VIEEPLAPGLGPASVVPFANDRGPFDPAPGQGPLTMPPIDTPVGNGGGGAVGIVPPPFAGELPPATPLGEGEPPGTMPTQPGLNQTDVGPNRDEAFPDRSWADIVTNVEEGSTGSLMFGVGVTSYGGLSGNFIYHESNFDISAWPRSWREFRDQRAFRGAQQDLRIELSPGTLVNRALISFRDPYFLNMPGGYAMGLGLSGYAFTRVYNGQFNEYRGGGRFSLGSQLGTSTYADVAFRAEDVRISNYYLPAPAEFLAVDGHTALFTLRPSIRFDNRNDPYAPNKGQYLEAAFEQGWGDFTFPKVTLEGRKYFTLGSRPDGSGKRLLTFRGYFGATGPDTPVYERFFAGDFRSMRGFTYRGVGPFSLGRNVGGLMSAIGSVEYQFPWTAGDRVQQVVFCDFGTVESGYDFTTFRASVGTGLRLYMPQQMFGPLPLAFDFAVPVAKGPDDREQLFTFFIGAFW
jgi:outer membrane protein insertion porin family